MKKWLIESQTSGETIGTYEAETKDEALDVMAQNLGYRDYADCCVEVPPTLPLKVTRLTFTRE